MSLPTLLAALAGALTTSAASPYLARLTRTAPDRDDRLWWRGRLDPTATVGVRRSMTGGVGLVCGALAGAAAGWTAAWPAFVWLALVVTPLVVIDVEHHRLPDRLVLAGLIGGVVLLGGAAVVSAGPEALERSGICAALVFAVFLAVSLAAPFGFGDTKLAAVLAGYLGWLGWAYVLYGILAGFLVGALVSVALLLTRRAGWRTAIPFGPALIAGALLVAALRLVPEAGR